MKGHWQQSPFSFCMYTNGIILKCLYSMSGIWSARTIDVNCLLVISIEWSRCNVHYMMKNINNFHIQWSAKKVAVAHMHFLESYQSSIWTDFSETFLDSQADVIECSMTEISVKVSLCRPRDIIIRVLLTFSVYQAIVLQYPY